MSTAYFPANMASEQSPLIQKINGETAQIRWRELQTYFAAGQALALAVDEDLIRVAAAMAEDDSGMIEQLMRAEKLGAVSDEQAGFWYDDDALVWASVVRPWVLVQAVQPA